MIRKKFLKFALLIPVMAGLCLMASAQNVSVKTKNKTVALAVVEEKIELDKTVHDFGTVKKEGDSVSAIFTIKNNTKTPIIILDDVRASCGCTTPDWTKGPIEPGKTGTVTATYKPSSVGPFEKSVTINVSSKDKTETFVVKIKGTVE
ncbi:MAG: DUF1573 domain-containing protein [Dysgonamonadaceae bacterium]|jgi:hypothetical protein|nr:DUF1573 domain-containing protein [Dysgonamonadaceae bacterium]